MKKRHGGQGMKRREFVRRLATDGIGGAAAVLSGLSFFTPKKQPKYNVLFIIGDDLRPQLGCYGEKQMKTPHVDGLASRGVVFERSFCQQALCAPSRASMLTGLRPDSTGIYNLKSRVQDKLPRHVTLPACFKQNGYQTVSIGKVFHHRQDSDVAWSRAPLRQPGPDYVTREGMRLAAENRKSNPSQLWTVGAPFEMADLPDRAYRDGKHTDAALQQLRRLQGKPFMLCVGYAKPHLPFAAPKKYWDLYDAEKIALPANPFPPANASSFSIKDYGELRDFLGIPRSADQPVPESMARRLIHGYYACVSFFDAQVGRLLRELKALHLQENTIVVLWGDNGWKLGTHGSWSKHTVFEDDTRVPLIVSVPGMAAAGKRSEALVEAVDIYPALCELCGLTLPGQPMEGSSFTPLLAEPGREWKKAAFSQYPRGMTSGAGSGNIMGYAMRTRQFRYVEWRWQQTGFIMERELYDHETDPGEDVNRIADPRYAERIAELARMLKLGWKGALPLPERDAGTRKP